MTTLATFKNILRATKNMCAVYHIVNRHSQENDLQHQLPSTYSQQSYKKAKSPRAASIHHEQLSFQTTEAASVCGLLLHRDRYVDDLATRMILQLHCYGHDTDVLILLISKQSSHFQENFALPVSFSAGLLQKIQVIPCLKDQAWLKHTRYHRC